MESSLPGRVRTVAAAALGILGLATGPLVLSLAPEVASGTAAIDLAHNPGNWEGPLTRSNDWSPHYRGAQAMAAALYRAPDGVVEIYVARYGMQRENAELAAGDNSILGGLQRLHIVGRSTLTTPAPLNELELADGGRERWIVWYGYALGERKFVSRYAEALWYGVASLRSEPVASVIAARARCEKDCAGARALLERFWHTGWGK
jgi:EpsI family protein